MKKILLFLIALSFSFLAKSQAPGIKWKNPNPSLLKVDLPKQKGFTNSPSSNIFQKKNESNRKLPFMNFTGQGIIYLPIDGMPCLVVNPGKIDPAMVSKIDGNIPYMPNGYKNYPAIYSK